jgi:6-pyruvoyltetrahydropterin/6-carboxytetrahydropterin synthase
MISIARRYRFPASHRLHSPELTADQNAALYGKCNNPFGHGHDYVLTVTATGEPDRGTGLILPVTQLDRLVEERVLQLFRSRNINLDVSLFSSLVPTTENIAGVIVDLLEEYWDDYLSESGARLHRVHVQETDRNGFEIVLPVRPSNSVPKQQIESLTVNA